VSWKIADIEHEPRTRTPEAASNNSGPDRGGHNRGSRLGRNETSRVRGDRFDSNQVEIQFRNIPVHRSEARRRCRSLGLR